MNLTKIVSTSTLVFILITAGLLLGLGSAGATNTQVQERLISIDKKGQDLTQALEAVADQAGVVFNVHGELPKATRDLSLKQAPLNQAMGHTLSIYGVRNHAAAYNAETDTIV